MITFNAVTPQEKWIKQNFESKANLMREMKITRPTIDKMCKSPEVFFKYLTKLARLTKKSEQKVVAELFKLSA